MKPMSSSLCLRSGDMVSLPRLWRFTQLPRLNPSNLHFWGTLQWLSTSLNWSNLLKPSSQCSTTGSQTKPMSSSFCLRSGDMLSWFARWVVIHYPRLNPSSLKFVRTLQWPSASLNWSNLLKPSSQRSVMASQTKPKSSSLCLRSGDKSLSCLWLLIQLPDLPP